MSNEAVYRTAPATPGLLKKIRVRNTLDSHFWIPWTLPILTRVKGSPVCASSVSGGATLTSYMAAWENKNSSLAPYGVVHCAVWCCVVLVLCYAVCSVVLCSVMLCSVVLCSVMFQGAAGWWAVCSVVQCCRVLCSVVQCCRVLCSLV